MNVKIVFVDISHIIKNVCLFKSAIHRLDLRFNLLELNTHNNYKNFV